MNNITIIEHHKLVRAVSARELHEVLEIDTRFNDWIDRMLDYGFEENTDYIVLLKNEQNLKPLGGRPSKDYYLTIDTAKEISMLQRTEKGREARRYFIECEKNLKEQSLAIPNFNDPYEMAIRWAEAYKAKELAQQERDNAIKTKAWIGARREATAMATASAEVRRANRLEDELGIGRNFKQVKAIKELTKYFYVNKGFYIRVGNILKELSNRRGYKIKRTPHSEYGEINAYEVELINEFLSEIDTNINISNKLSRYRKFND